MTSIPNYSTDLDSDNETLKEISSRKSTSTKMSTKKKQWITLERKIHGVSIIITKLKMVIRLTLDVTKLSLGEAHVQPVYIYYLIVGMETL